LPTPPFWLNTAIVAIASKHTAADERARAPHRQRASPAAVR